MWDYSEKVLDHFHHPRNVGTIENPDGVGEVGALACGDALKLMFKLDKDGRITQMEHHLYVTDATANGSYVMSVTARMHGDAVTEYRITY